MNTQETPKSAELKPDPHQAGRSQAEEWKQLLARNFLVVILVALCVTMGFLHPVFLSGGNISNILFQAAFVGLAGCGMTILIAGGMIDLSESGVVAIAAIAIAMVLPSTTIGGALVTALILGAGLGLINGLLVAYVKIAPFIATLGSLYLFLGLAFISTGQKVVPIVSTNYRMFTTGSIGPLPVPFLVFVLCAIITGFILHHTYFGRAVRALGSNEVAASLAGLPVRRVKLLAFVFAGLTYALSAVFMSGRLSSAEGNMATGFEMSVIAAVVVGGTALRGGNGTVVGTAVGALLFAVINNSMNLLGIASYWQYVVTGVVLVLAIALGSARSGGSRIRGEG